MKMRLPTRSDMICGYACLKGILRDCEGRLYCPRLGFVLFLYQGLCLGRIEETMKSVFVRIAHDLPTPGCRHCCHAEHQTGFLVH